MNQTPPTVGSGDAEVREIVPVVRARFKSARLARPPATIPPTMPAPPRAEPVERPREGGGTVHALSVIEAIREGKPHTPAIHESVAQEDPIVAIERFNLWYSKNHALHDIDMLLPRGKVTAMIGPSGCGKSTLLRSINRLNDLIEGVRVEGRMMLNGSPIYTGGVDVIDLRKRLGMVFQKANPFPMSIFDNVVYALRIRGERRRKILEESAERALRSAALWTEVKDRLKASAMGLSGGQQQRLCIARAIVTDPEVLLLDEPCSALDPIATMRIEELIDEISARYTVVIVTHNMQQAARVSDFTAFMYLGRLVEYGATADIFQRPRLPETEQYVTGRYG